MIVLCTVNHNNGGINRKLASGLSATIFPSLQSSDRDETRKRLEDKHRSFHPIIVLAAPSSNAFHPIIDGHFLLSTSNFIMSFLLIRSVHNNNSERIAHPSSVKDLAFTTAIRSSSLLFSDRGPELPSIIFATALRATRDHVPRRATDSSDRRQER